MSHDSGNFLDHLYEMDDTTFEHVYELTKRAACFRFGVEGYAVGYQDAYAGRDDDNQFASAMSRRDYEMGYRDGSRKRRARRAASPAREFGEPAVWL